MATYFGSIGDISLNWIDPKAVLSVEKIRMKRELSDGLAGDFWTIEGRFPDPIAVTTMTYTTVDVDTLDTEKTATGYIGSVQIFSCSWAGSSNDQFSAKVLGVNVRHIPIFDTGDGNRQTLIQWTLALTRISA